MKSSESTTPIRALMPEGFQPKIVARAKARLGKNPDRATISRTVNDERINSKYWPDIEAVAIEVNPVEYKKRLAFLKQSEQQFQAA